MCRLENEQLDEGADNKMSKQANELLIKGAI